METELEFVTLPLIDMGKVALVFPQRALLIRRHKRELTCRPHEVSFSLYLLNLKFRSGPAGIQDGTPCLLNALPAGRDWSRR